MSSNVSSCRHLAMGGLLVTLLAGADAAPYAVTLGDGRPSSLGAIAQAMATADVVYLGEEHDDAVAHRLQAELLAMARQQAGERHVTLAMEMFERDVQVVLDEYGADRIREKDLLTDARPWPNFKTDYQPLVEFARTHRMRVVASNAPRRYVNMVGRLGPEALAALSPEARGHLAPLPLPPASAAYAAKVQSAMGEMPHESGPRLLAAQVLRDATMAGAIAYELTAHPGGLVIHVNGKFHSEGRLGIPEHLSRLCPTARQVVVTMAKASDGPAEGDFVIRTRPGPAGGGRQP